jgi:hypothetical protein
VTGGRPCKYCGAPLKWVETVDGGRMPLDPEPNSGGNVYMLDGRARVLTTADKQEKLPPTRWMPHHATCPNKPKPRRRR